jgi:hypothetical protein
MVAGHWNAIDSVHWSGGIRHPFFIAFPMHQRVKLPDTCRVEVRPGTTTDRRMADSNGQKLEM